MGCSRATQGATHRTEVLVSRATRGSGHHPKGLSAEAGTPAQRGMLCARLGPVAFMRRIRCRDWMGPYGNTGMAFV